jgi:hypothetical protein
MFYNRYEAGFPARPTSLQTYTLLCMAISQKRLSREESVQLICSLIADSAWWLRSRADSSGSLSKASFYSTATTKDYSMLAIAAAYDIDVHSIINSSEFEPEISWKEAANFLKKRLDGVNLHLPMSSHTRSPMEKLCSAASISFIILSSQGCLT